MKKMVYSLAIAMIILISVAMIPATAVSSSNEKIPVIIGFYDKSDAELVKAHGGEIKYQYNNIHAIAASLPEQAINALENNPNVKYIEEDTEVHILGETLPWGVDRVEADIVQAANPSFTGAGVKVAVIDTGIDYTHPDLTANYVDGYNVINPLKSPLDDNGHGTHVAGTIAAVDNDIGVIGVAPQAKLYAVKVLNKRGSGSISDINAGIDWAIDNEMDVISMSLGGSYYSESQEDVCQNASNAGIVIVAAAGNDYYSSVSYPAAYSSVIAVSATDKNDKIAYFSNIGLQIELAAPGVNINSTTLGGGYSGETWSGTSMATPHVSGVVALLLSSNVSGTALDLNGDDQWNPVEIRARLNATADDIVDNFGTIGWDQYYGNGIVNASAALNGLVPLGVADSSTGDDGSDSTNPLLVASEPDVDVKINPSGKFISATSTVIVTSEGIPVPEVTVKGYWIYDDDADTNLFTAKTDVTGTVVFISPITFKDEYIPDKFDFVVTETTM